MAKNRQDEYQKAVTLRSISASILAIILISIVVNFGGMIEGSTYRVGGEPLAFPAVWMVVGLSLVGGLVFSTTRFRILSRAEMFCVLFVALLATPLVNYGFWRYLMGRIFTIPISADFEKIDALDEKLWPHGPNLTVGILNQENSDAFSGSEGFSWQEIEFDSDRKEFLPVLRSDKEGGLTTFRVRIPMERSDAPNPKRDQPHLVSLLVSAQELGPESYFYCRIYYDGGKGVLDEVFSSNLPNKKTFLHPAGFRRVGNYGIRVPYKVEESLDLEFGLWGRGSVAFHDLVFWNVSAIEDAFQGRKIITQKEYDRLPENERSDRTVMPENLFSFRGILFYLTAFVPLGAWWKPFLAWGGIAVLILAASYALIVVMRRQWVDRERFLMPLLHIPTALLGGGDKDETIPPIWKNKFMWTGFALTMVWCLARTWYEYNPSLPNLNVNISLRSYITDPTLSSALGSEKFTLLAMCFSLALFMDLNILGSLFLGFLLFRGQFWFGEASGLSVTAGYPWQTHQMFGSLLGYALILLFFARKHLWDSMKEAYSGKRREDEALSPRTAGLTFLVSFSGIFLWSWWVDINLWGALMFFAIMVLWCFGAAKLRAECGAAYNSYFPHRWTYMVPFLGGVTLLGAKGTIFLTLTGVTLGMYIFMMLPGIQLELIELGRRFKIRSRHLTLIAILGVSGGLLIGGWFFLSTVYAYGVDQFGNITEFDPEVADIGKFTAVHERATEHLFGERDMSLASEWFNAETKTVFVSGGIAALLAIIRQFFAGFWFHPIGYILSATQMMTIAWGSIGFAWLVRLLVLKLGGSASVREKLFPFAIGVFFASAATQLVIVAVNTWMFFNHPGTPGIGEVY